MRVGDVRTSDFPQIAMRKGIELEMVINGKPGTLRPAARMTDPHTGIVMDVSTTQPCMVVYGDSIGDRTVTGKGGKVYRNFYAMSFETEGYLDAVNHPNFRVDRGDAAKADARSDGLQIQHQVGAQGPLRSALIIPGKQCLRSP